MAQVEATMQGVMPEVEAEAAQAAGAVAATAPVAAVAQAESIPAGIAGVSIPAIVEPAKGEGAAEAEPAGEGASNENSATAKPKFASITDAQAQEILTTRNSGVKPMLNRYGYRFVKRAFDIVASGCAIALLFVPSLVLCAVICIKSPGAGPIYGQTRVGRVKRDGSFSTFRLYKFRSMVPDADERLCALRDKNEADGPLFKIKEDPRVIPGVGKFIRKHSIDELPQLINVFCGKIPLRILKTRPDSLGKAIGAFALPANNGSNEGAAFAQVAARMAGNLRRAASDACDFTAGETRRPDFFAKRILCAIYAPIAPATAKAVSA